MAEIEWRPWNEETFADAQRQSKPIVLSLTAPWCQFCTQMDEQTYGNEAIAQYINENFIPVRVDTDRRPEINSRYGQGGWPSTCLLTPEGDVLFGGTFLPPDQMAQLLPQVKNQFDQNKPGVAQHVAQLREQLKQQNQTPPLDSSLQITHELVRGILLGVMHNFDFAFGGFGHNGQKFPHPDALEFIIEQYSRTERAGEANSDLRLMIERTLRGLAEGGLNDPASGGFFRYAQTPDWREPQVEKLLEDSAAMARVFSRAYQLLDDDQWKAIAEKTLRYMHESLYDSETGTWGGSQYADAEYYAQPLGERMEWNPPAVDDTLLTGSNALAARAYVAWWQATGDTPSLDIAQKAIDYLLANILQADGAIDHCLPTEDSEDWQGRSPVGLLSDAADVCGACLDLYEAGRGAKYLDTAAEIADWAKSHLEDPRSGGMFDAVVRPDAVGNLRIATKDARDNFEMADALLRLYLATGDDEYAKAAQRILQAFIPLLPQLGFFGASFALAAERALMPPIIIHLIGSLNDTRTQALLTAANKPYRFDKFIQPLDPSHEDDAEHIENLGYAKPTEPIAYVSVGPTVQEPTTDPVKLTNLILTSGV